jgi:hypothetical protein
MKRDRENFTIPFLSADIQLNRSPHLMQKTRATSFLVPHFGQTSVMELASGLCVFVAGAVLEFVSFDSCFGSGSHSGRTYLVPSAASPIAYTIRELIHAAMKPPPAIARKSRNP